ATVRNTAISGNAATAGGGIYNTGTLTIEDSIISGNSATASGGGMYVSLPGVESEGEIAVTITDTTITGNDASVDGGGVYAFERFPLGGPFAAGMVVTGGAISDNTATSSGGGIYTEGDVSIDGVTMANNTTGASGGGAVFHGAGGAITIVASTLDGNGADGDGGAILSDGLLTIRDTTVADSVTGKAGGGVYMVASPTSLLQIIGSTFSGNRAGTAGGGFLLDSNSAGVVINSTVSDNLAPAGGGFYVQGDAELTVVSTTVAENGGVANSDAMAIVGTATFRNTLVDGGCGSLTTGVVVSSGGNIQTPGSDCGFTGPTDLEVTDTGLGPLQDNGGPTETMAPLVGSPALNWIDPAECVDADGSPLVVDQIGTARPQEGFCEVGAVEVLP
ncbi:MAG: choice-of-anchor Q domain-containing protein, partial [Myxococcota bacterium]